MSNSTLSPLSPEEFEIALKEGNKAEKPLFFRNDDPERSTVIFEEIISSAEKNIYMLADRLDGSVFKKGDLYHVITTALEKPRPFEMVLVVRQRDEEGTAEPKDDKEVWGFFRQMAKLPGRRFRLEMATDALKERTQILKDRQPIGYYDFIVADRNMYRIEDYKFGQERLYRSFNGFNEPEGGTADQLADMFLQHLSGIPA